MPLYEYECDACHHRFEVIQKFSDAPLTDCPKCGGRLEKLLSSPAIQFKGTGWYITDYARAGKSDGGGRAASGKSDSKAEDKSGSASETKTETKADAVKSESKSETKSESKPSTPSTS